MKPVMKNEYQRLIIYNNINPFNKQGYFIG